MDMISTLIIKGNIFFQVIEAQTTWHVSGLS